MTKLWTLVGSVLRMAIPWSTCEQWSGLQRITRRTYLLFFSGDRSETDCQLACQVWYPPSLCDLFVGICRGPLEAAQSNMYKTRVEATFERQAFRSLLSTESSTQSLDMKSFFALVVASALFLQAHALPVAVPGIESGRHRSLLLLKHLDVSDDDPDKLEPLPAYILPLPQFYFDLDVRSKSDRFESLVPPLDPSNADILSPKFHTFLESLVAFNRVKHDIYIGYLLRYRVQYEDDASSVTPPPKELLPAERAILSELQTDEARWYIGGDVSERPPGFDELRDYNRRRARNASSASSLSDM
ncbi:hypothetical protein LXA43DRAFT_1079153 [Ganoderma leucocontextum]|nr:hypothetical protein LXA43DRAFT_1079153 [Ganoderma leucocontextum]